MRVVPQLWSIFTIIWLEIDFKVCFVIPFQFTITTCVGITLYMLHSKYDDILLPLTDGKCLACAYRAKFMEVSVVINHNVDELLVGILTQIRLKEELQKEIAEGLVDPSTVDGANGQGSSNSWIRNKGLVRASMKAKQMFTWLFGKDDDQLANCENFQVL